MAISTVFICDVCGARHERDDAPNTAPPPLFVVRRPLPIRYDDPEPTSLLVCEPCMSETVSAKLAAVDEHKRNLETAARAQLGTHAHHPRLVGVHAPGRAI